MGAGKTGAGTRGAGAGEACAKPGTYYDAGRLSVDYYDVVTSLDPIAAADIPFYLARLPPTGAQVMELGCGTGRVAAALAARGHEVLGLDNAPAMLARAERRRRTLPAPRQGALRFVEGDMTAFTLPRLFDAVLIPFYSFNHLPDRRTRTRAMETAARHLRPGGWLAIHVLTPAALKDPRIDPPPRRPGLEITFENDGSQLEVTWFKRAVDLEARTTLQWVEYRLLAPDGSLKAASEERLHYHWFEPEETARAAAKAGLVVAEPPVPLVEGRPDNVIAVYRKPATLQPRR